MRKLGRSLAIIGMVLILFGSTGWAHPVYGQNGEVIGETLEWHDYGNQLMPGPDIADVLPRAWGYETYDTDEIADLLTECLEFIEDGSDTMEPNLNALVPYDTILFDYGTGTSQVVKTIPGEISKKKYELNRLERETELYKKIKDVIKNLKGE